MRNRFDRQLTELNQDMIQMGHMIGQAIGMAISALNNRDKEQAEKVIDYDDEINEEERIIENLCLKLLLQQQPVARDLRVISSALKMISDMERIGDQAADIAEIITFLGGRSGGECEYISLMAKSAIKMVTESVDAFVKRDLELANTAIRHDDIVDDYFKKVKSSLIKMIADKPDDGEYALDLLMIAKYFERIGDHAVNIAEWVVFSVTGSHKEGTV